ncbi:hypothetical protein C8R46DRAFT_1210053 [Mycena filopes]|nr:hypothetical protein C8R46DRAFT_1210053 [Mycena filopes]
MSSNEEDEEDERKRTRNGEAVNRRVMVLPTLNAALPSVAPSPPNRLGAYVQCTFDSFSPIDHLIAQLDLNRTLLFGLKILLVHKPAHQIPHEHGRHRLVALDSESALNAWSDALHLTPPAHDHPPPTRTSSQFAALDVNSVLPHAHPPLSSMLAMGLQASRPYPRGQSRVPSRGGAPAPAAGELNHTTMFAATVITLLLLGPQAWTLTWVMCTAIWV